MAKKIDYVSMFTLRKDGRYQGYYKGADGKRHVVCDRDPEKLYHKLLEKEAPPVTTFADIAEMWEGEHRQTITAKSWNNYAPHVENIVSIHGSKTMQQITAQDISNDLIRAKAQGYSATVVRTRRSIYRMIFDCAIAKGYAEFNPVISVRMPKGLKTGKRIAPTEEEMQVIFSSLDQPFGLFPFFLLCTGLRKSEALALEWSDVDLYEKEISVTKSLEYLSNSNPRVKAPKTEAGNRIVPILDVLVEPLKDAKRRSKSPYLFPQGKSNRAKGGGIMSEHAYEGEWEVFDNMAFGLKLRKTPKDEIKRRVEEAARILDISHLLERRPKALSGGQKQRVALGRAIVRNPKVFLLDEPLSNLDAKLRASMRTELTKLHKKVETTFIYVTHDQVEAMTMASRIVVMRDGLIQQVDTPQNLYDTPCNLFVAGFIGTPQMNFINGTLNKKGEDLYFDFENCSVKLPAEKANNPALKDYIGQEVVAGLRPECIHDQPAQVEAFADSTIEAFVEVTELMGAEIYLYLNVGKSEEGDGKIKIVNDGTNLIARVSSRSTSRAGDTIKVAFDTSRIHIFDKDTERCICH